MVDRGQELPYQQSSDEHEPGQNDKRQLPAKHVPGGRRNGHAEHECHGAAGDRDRHGATDLLLGHEVCSVRADDGPEQSVGHAADHSGRHDKLIAGCDRRECVTECEHDEHGHKQAVTRQTASEVGQRGAGKYDREGEPGNEQANLRLSDSQGLAHIGQHARRQHFGGDREEDGSSQDDQAEPGEGFCSRLHGVFYCFRHSDCIHGRWTLLFTPMVTERGSAARQRARPGPCVLSATADQSTRRVARS